jgi:hypothetical protein
VIELLIPRKRQGTGRFEWRCTVYRDVAERIPVAQFFDYSKSGGALLETTMSACQLLRLTVNGFCVERWQPAHDWEFPGITLPPTREMVAIQRRNDEGEWVEPRWFDADGQEVVP